MTSVDSLSALVRDIVAEVEADFAAAGLRMELNGPDRRDPLRLEMSIYIWKDEEVIDVLEFPLVSDAGEALSDEELSRWLRENLLSVRTNGLT